MKTKKKNFSYLKKNISYEFKLALEENLERLRESIAQGELSRELIEEYKKIFKNIFAKACEI